MNEIFKDIPGYEGLYQASNLWNVKSLINNIILKCHNKRYSIIILKRKSFSVHNLIMLTFKWERPVWYDINHIDWNKLNNRLENLEYITKSENTIHAYKMWLHRNNNFQLNHPSKWKFWKNHFSSKKVNQYTKSWEFIKTWDSARDVTRETWICYKWISYICRWKAPSYKGYIWKFA